jgi:hypothetical protein
MNILPTLFEKVIDLPTYLGSMVVLALFLTVSGLALTYVSIGLVRKEEQRRAYDECEDRMRLLRRQLTRR